MRSIIEELYDLFPGVNNYSTPERSRITEEYISLCEQIEAQFGPDFMDRLSQLSDQRRGYHGEDHFAAGFRAGIRLMAEVFTSPTE